MKIKSVVTRALLTLAVASLALPACAGSADKAQGRSPTPESIQASYDELDYQRAVQAYLWSIPSMYMYSLRKSLADTFGATPNTNVPIWADLMDNETVRCSRMEHDSPISILTASSKPMRTVPSTCISARKRPRVTSQTG